MAKHSKKRTDDDDEAAPLGDWVLASWHCYWSLEVNFVVKAGGKPQADWHPTSDRYSAYRWKSYHAARKFQKAHSQLRGYVILNLAVIERQAEEQRQVCEEWIHRDKEPTAPVAPRSRSPP